MQKLGRMMTDIAEKKYMNKKMNVQYMEIFVKVQRRNIFIVFSTKYPKKSQLSKDLVEKEDSMID